MTTKVCSKCGVEKEVGEFGEDRRRKDGLNLKCKACANAAQKAWRDANLELARAEAKARRDANLELARAKERARREANPEATKARYKRYREANSEAMKAREKRRMETNPESERARYKRYREANVEVRKGQTKAWREALPDAYVSYTLKQSGIEPTPETINTKRTQLKIIRKIKEIEKFNKQKESK